MFIEEGTTKYLRRWKQVRGYLHDRAVSESSPNLNDDGLNNSWGCLWIQNKTDGEENKHISKQLTQRLKWTTKMNNYYMENSMMFENGEDSAGEYFKT